QALEAGYLTLGELQRTAANICRFIIDTPVMSRSLQAYHPIKFFPSYSTLELVNNSAHHIEQLIKLNTQCSTEFILQVNQPGVYQCIATMVFARNAQAQSSCSVSLNDVFALSLPIHGTNGDTVMIEGLEVQLETGYYQVGINFVKKGAELKTLSFMRKDNV
ncbi:beta-glucosidase, partial [Vibrio metschnikovii]|nr:beta-glucosidase [Vibrio metschnikovii]